MVGKGGAAGVFASRTTGVTYGEVEFSSFLLFAWLSLATESGLGRPTALKIRRGRARILFTTTHPRLLLNLGKDSCHPPALLGQRRS